MTQPIHLHNILSFARQCVAEAESSSFDADAIVAASEAELYNSTSSEVWGLDDDFCASDYVASAQIAMSLDW